MSWDFLKRMLSLDGRLSGAPLKRRRLLFVMLCITLVSVTVAALVNMTQGFSFSVIGPLVCGAPTVVLLSQMLAFREVSESMLVICVYIWTFGVALADVNERTVQTYIWPTFVLIVDFLLVMRVQRKHTIAVVVFVVLWQLVNLFESVMRAGLYDLPGTYSQKVRRDRFDDMNACATLPCRQDLEWAAQDAFSTMLVFVFDFVATRGFADDATREHNAMQTTISTVQEIATLLAAYDIDRVADILARPDTRLQIPPEMHTALSTLGEHLSTYRPYLPTALFEGINPAVLTQSTLVNPPGLHNEDVAITFTDIRGSTAIWEAEPNGMREALRIHNAVIRCAIAECEGYEVKTIGDAFIAAFPATVNALNFGVTVQTWLHEAEWPPSLLEVPLCAPRLRLWGGLTVRVGINSGPVTTELNALTHRMDYFGHTVNVAARLEGSCTPGAVALPYALWESDCAGCVPSVAGDPISQILKGVAEPIVVCSVWPAKLAGRKLRPLQDVREVPIGLPRCISGPLAPALEYGPSRVSHGTATITVMEIGLGDDGDALRTLSVRLEAVTTLLEQSGGTMVSLLGSHSCIGWNVTRVSQSHVEAGIRFVNKILALDVEGLVLGSATASGLVDHGGVGSSTQRFLTVLGEPVQQAWKLCEDAVNEEANLYLPPTGTRLPASLTASLLESHHFRSGVYKLIDQK